jgi:hypothetical protein
VAEASRLPLMLRICNSYSSLPGQYKRMRLLIWTSATGSLWLFNNLS